MTAQKSYSVQTPSSKQIGTAVENRDGSISVRLFEVPVPFVGTLKLVVDAAARDVRPSSPPRPKIAFAAIMKPPPGAVEAYNRAHFTATTIMCPCDGKQPGHTSTGANKCTVRRPIEQPAFESEEAARAARPLGAFVAIACSCNGSKAGHEPLGDKGKSQTCAVPNDGRNHG